MMQLDELERLTPDEMQVRIARMKRNLMRLGVGLLGIILIVAAIEIARRELSTGWFLVCDLTALVATIAIGRWVRPREH